MDVMDAIKQRRSIRGYENRPVEESKLKAILEAGRLAPSASNKQDWKFVVVRDAEIRKKLAVACNQQAFIAEAAVVLVCCATNMERKMAGGQACGPIDVAIAMDHITLKAMEEGLGTCWIGSYNEAAIKKILGIPDGVSIIDVLPLGYPKEIPQARPRKEIKELYAFERWE